MTKGSIDFKLFKLERSFKQRFNNIGIPITFLFESIIYFLLSSIEILFYFSYLILFYKFNFFWKLTFVTILVIYIMVDILLYFNIYEYVRKINMKKTFIYNKESQTLEEVKALYKNDDGKMIAEIVKTNNTETLDELKSQKRKFSKFQNKYNSKDKEEIDKIKSKIKNYHEKIIIEKNVYRELDKEVEYYKTKKRMESTPTLIHSVLPLALIIISIITGLIHNFKIFNLKIPIEISYLLILLLLIMIKIQFTVYFSKKILDHEKKSREEEVKEEIYSLIKNKSSE